jgi:hypothetical protein
VSDAPWQVVRELVQGLSHDLLPRDDRYWALAGLPPRTRFEDAARAALAEDQGRRPGGARGLLVSLEEALVDRLSPRRREKAKQARAPAASPAHPRRG